MNISQNSSRNECIKVIGENEIEQIARASIEHFAIPIIAGISMDLISQKEYEAMGGVGKKPEPLNPETKLEIYNRIKQFIKPKILKEIAKLVDSFLPLSLEALSDENLRFKARALSEQVMQPEPNWKRLPDLFKDHVCLFKELEANINLNAKLISFHDILCPIMCKFRDSGELFDKIKLNELLH